MRFALSLGAVTAALATVVSIAAAQEFGQGERRDLLKRVETTDLPQGKALIGGGERLMSPGGRSPWHTAGGPKLLYVLEGAMAVAGLGGETLMTCGPAPKLCFSPHKELFFFRNTGAGPLKFVIIGIDPVQKPTNHEIVGQVAEISGNRVTLVVGDLRSSDLTVPRREVTITASTLSPISVGDDVVTSRYNEKDHSAEGLVKLSRRWQ